jgi:nicotinamidase-related amidase
VRSPVNDYLLTPQNAALVVIDYQPTQINSVKSIDHHQLVPNIVTVVKTARTYRLPIVLSTFNVMKGANRPAITPLLDAIGDVRAIDRASINPWENIGLRQAVEATGRRKLIIAALWTESSLLFTSLGVIRRGLEVFVPVDAVGGTSVLAHDTALRRLEQAGAQLTTIPSLLCELHCDGSRNENVPALNEILSRSRPEPDPLRRSFQQRICP